MNMLPAFGLSFAPDKERILAARSPLGALSLEAAAPLCFRIFDPAVFAVQKEGLAPNVTTLASGAAALEVEKIAALRHARQFRNRFFHDELFAGPSAFVLHELLHVHEQFELLREALPARLVAERITRTIVEEQHFEWLSFREKLLRLYESFVAGFSHGTSTPCRAGAGKPRSAGWLETGGPRLSLSGRAFDRVWTNIAEAWVVDQPEDFFGFVRTFRVVLVDAVQREARVTTRQPTKQGNVPSTCAWVHSYSLHTGLSPPAAANFRTPSEGIGIRDFGMGGLRGPFQGSKAARDLPLRPYCGRSCKRLRNHSTQAGYFARNSPLDGSGHPRRRVQSRWAYRDHVHAELGRELRVVGRRRRLRDGA